MDPLLVEAITVWTQSPKRRSASANNFNTHGEATLLMNNIMQETLSSNSMHKCRVPFKRSRVNFKDYDIENDMALRNICFSLALKRSFLDTDHMWKATPCEFYRWLRAYGVGHKDYEFLLRDYTLSVDYKFVSPLKIEFVDKRNIVNANDIIYSCIQMTSGYVSDACRKLADRRTTFGFPKPIMNLFASIPSDEVKLWQSKNNYSMRKKDCACLSFSESVDRCYMSKVLRKVHCLVEVKDPTFLDTQMLHLDECYDDSEGDKRLRKSYCRLWFLRKVPELIKEHERLDAKWRRRSKSHDFFICKQCEDAYVLFDWDNVDIWDQDTKLARKMNAFCSYYCYNEYILALQMKQRKEEVQQYTMSRTFCPACQKSCYIPIEDMLENDPMARFVDGWRMVNIHDGHFNYKRAVCSDECHLYVKKKIGEKQSYVMARNNLVKAMVTANGEIIVRDTSPTIVGTLFRFYTCFNCCRILHPGLGKICHFRNFPRIPWAYTCYDKACISRLLHVAFPVCLFEDSQFFATGHSSPAGVEPCLSMWDTFQKQISSANGRRFTLTIFE